MSEKKLKIKIPDPLIMTRQWYAAVRVTPGETGPWLDCSSIASVADAALENAEAMDRNLPAWSFVNPIIAIAAVELKFVEYTMPVSATPSAD